MLAILLVSGVIGSQQRYRVGLVFAGIQRVMRLRAGKRSDTNII